MNTENLSTLKIHKLTQTQYERELANGNIDETALYLTPDEATLEKLKTYTDEQIAIAKEYTDTIASEKSDKTHTHSIANVSGLQSALDGKAASSHTHSEYMIASNPTGTGSFSMNRLADSTVGNYSIALGQNTTASGYASYAEGGDTVASNLCAHAEGNNTTASGVSSHAEGVGSTASGVNSHAQGLTTIASGLNSHAEGSYTIASGMNSHAAGSNTIANKYQYVVGKYNADTTTVDAIADTGSAEAGLFIVGIGTSDTTRVNGFRINHSGNAYGVGTYGTSGADYAEYFEWVDGNSKNEDRRGRFVTLDGDKIRYATSEDDYILGVVSAEPTIVGDIQSEMWHNMYLKDVYGSKIIEIVEVEESTDEHGNVIPAHTERRWVLNPDYNTDLKYVSREERPEWDAVGIVGKLVVVDDGTCQVNGYCYPNIDGIATASTDKTAYRVIDRLDDAHIRIFIK